MKAAFQADLEKAKKAAKVALGTMTTAASEMFAFYLNQQDHQQADGKWPVCQPTRWLSGRPKGNVLQVI